MIDVLQQLLEVVKSVPDYALYVLLGFGIYKAIIYLSTTGAIVFLGRLLIVKVHDLFKSSPKSTILESQFKSKRDYELFVENVIKLRKDKGKEVLKVTDVRVS